MDIPLNIDWRQIFLHLFNFVILVGGLYFLLYSPIKKFMAKRESFYRDLDEKANAKLESAQSYEAQVRERLAHVDEEVKETRFKAQAELDAYMSRQMLQANEQAEKLISEARKSAEEERRTILDKADKEILEIAKTAAAKIIHADTDAAFSQFLDAAERDVQHES